MQTGALQEKNSTAFTTSTNSNNQMGTATLFAVPVYQQQPIQKMELEEEQPMQAKLTIQLKIDITPAPPPTESNDNNNDGTAQLKELEEEMPLQGKFIVQKRELEDELPIQGKFIAQRMELEEEQPMQGKFIIQRKEREEQVPIQLKFKIPSSAPTEQKPFQRFALPKSNEPEAVKGPIQRFVLSTEPIQKKANNTGLPDNLKVGVENLSGFSMDDVKVHYNSAKPAQLQAHAYAQGTDIHIGPGQEKHLPHEAWHVVQQKQGRVKATMQMKGGVGVNDDRELESEADIMGGKAFTFINYRPEILFQRKIQEPINIKPLMLKLYTNQNLFNVNNKTNEKSNIYNVISNGKPQTEKVKQFADEKIVQRIVDMKNSAFSERRNYIIPFNNKNILYSKTDAIKPVPSSLYIRQDDVTNDEIPIALYSWTPNVRLFKLREEDPSSYLNRIGGLWWGFKKCLTKKMRPYDPEPDMEKMIEELRGNLKSLENFPSIGIIGKNDCKEFANYLQDLIGIEDGRSIDLKSELKIGDKMYVELETGCNFHAATIVAADGGSKITLEANGDDEDLSLPEFFIHSSFEEFSSTNGGDGKKYPNKSIKSIGENSYHATNIEKNQLIETKKNKSFKNNKDRDIKSTTSHLTVEKKLKSTLPNASASSSSSTAAASLSDPSMAGASSASSGIHSKKNYDSPFD